MTIGIPYAKREISSISGQTVAVCPECEARIVLSAMKDFESFTGEEYAAHYEEKHTTHARKPTTPTGIAMADGEEDGFTEMLVAVEDEARAESVMVAQSILSELKASGAGAAAIGAAGRIVRALEEAANG